MRNLLFILLLFILLPLASANTFLPNAIIGEEKENFTTDVDNYYTLNISDVLTQFDMKYEVNKYPQTIVYNFYNVNNQTLTFKTVISKENIYPVGFKIIESHTAYLNLKPLYFKSMFKNDTVLNKTVIYLLDFDKYKSYISLRFDAESMYFESFALDFNSRLAFFVNKFSLTNQSLFLSYPELKLKYTDKTLELNKYNIASQYDSLNFIFKFLFLAGKAIIGVANLTGVISTTDFLNYQLAVLMPLTILNFILNTILFIIGFIWNNLLISLGIIILITFIFSVITTKDIYEAIPKFISNVIYIFTLLFVNPVKWIFEKIVKFWT